MPDRTDEQATAERMRALVMADVRGGADLRPAVLCSNAVFTAICPGCGRGAGLWCAPWCEYADPGESCPDCSAVGDCHPWCPRREEVPGA